MAGILVSIPQRRFSVLRSLSLVAVLVLVAPAPAADIPSALTDYVYKKDDSFSWKLVDKKESDFGTVYTIDLISQTWHDIKWDHKLQVYVPKGVKPQPTMLLWNQGGTPGAVENLLGVELARRVGAPVAMLFGIPKQPLFGGKREDALIAETFVRYLETKDASWPLLFPMVKSLIRAMDALQAFAKDEWNYEVKDFVVTGASKRGWTSWLTAATGDKRVKAIAPLVIDTLNMPVQMENHIKSFGRYSEMINDYTARQLVPLPDTEDARKLWRMVDPYVYRERITVPKMIINGTNDPYWPQDALNTYWDDLKGEKYILYVPNAGHDLTEVNADGKKERFPQRAVNTLAAFARAQIFNLPMPNLSWVCTEADGLCKLSVQAGKPKAVRVWVADAPTRDFRKSRWVEDKAAQSPFEVKAPEKGFRVFYAECDYDMNGLSYTLCTQLRVLEAKK
jgi:PhoPQ-activated pathogenicity-related protein